jgi:hypothetical protein
MLVNFDAIAQGNVSVGYYQEGGRWFALARQFDLLGSGATREEALNQLRELVQDYVEASLTWGMERFLNPAPDDEWERASRYRQEYSVTLIFARTSPRQKSPPELRKATDLSSLIPFKDRFAGAALAAI